MTPFNVSPGANAGWWYRFDRYEVRGGYVRPVTGTSGRWYDPWTSYRSAAVSRAGRDGARPSGQVMDPTSRAPGTSRQARPPYLSLIELLRRQPYVRDAASDAAIAEWCTGYGLLGVLPHRARMVTLATRWHHQEGLPAGALVPKRVSYLHVAGGWRADVGPLIGTGLPMLVDAGEHESQVVQRSLLPSDWPGSGVLLGDLREELWRHEPLAATWGSFFPDVPDIEKETFEYPAPLSDAFWSLYAEPAGAFLDAASTLSEALDRVGARTSDGDPSHVAAVQQGQAILHALTSSVRPFLSSTEAGGFRQNWVASTLLGSFAMMALQDLAQGHVPRFCEGCGTPFLSAAYQARYCSERCRHRVQKRNQRRQHRKAGETSN